MNAGSMGLVAGLISGLALVLAGFGAFLLVLFMGALGLVVGKVAGGEVDTGRYFDRSRFRGRDRSRR